HARARHRHRSGSAGAVHRPDSDTSGDSPGTGGCGVEEVAGAHTMKQVVVTRTASPADLASDLRRVVRGEVRFDRGSRALYATDGSNYRQVPIGVVVPRHIDDVVAAVEVCRQHRAPILSRGGGTSLAGQCCNVAVVMDMSKYLDRVLSIDTTRKIARVE